MEGEVEVATIAHGRGKKWLLLFFSSDLDIRGVPLAVSPGACDAREGAVRMVKLLIVATEEESGEGLLQNKHIKTRQV